MKLELKHLVPYLPYELKVQDIDDNTINTLSGIKLKNKDLWFFYQKGTKDRARSKPILRPLSDFIDINSEIMNELNYDLSTQMELVDLASKRQHYSHCSYLTIEICFENHIDVFRLIENGLAISIHDVCQADA